MYLCRRLNVEVEKNNDHLLWSEKRFLLLLHNYKVNKHLRWVQLNVPGLAEKCELVDFLLSQSKNSIVS